MTKSRHFNKDFSAFSAIRISIISSGFGNQSCLHSFRIAVPPPPEILTISPKWWKLSVKSWFKNSSRGLQPRNLSDLRRSGTKIDNSYLPFEEEGRKMSEAQMPLQINFYFITFFSFPSSSLLLVRGKLFVQSLCLIFLLFHQFFTDQKLFASYFIFAFILFFSCDTRESYDLLFHKLFSTVTNSSFPGFSVVFLFSLLNAIQLLQKFTQKIFRTSFNRNRFSRDLNRNWFRSEMFSFCLGFHRLAIFQRRVERKAGE